MKVGPKCGITSNSQCDLSHPAHSCANHSSQESTRNKNPHPNPFSVGWDGVVVRCCAVISNPQKISCIIFENLFGPYFLPHQSHSFGYAPSSGENLTSKI